MYAYRGESRCNRDSQAQGTCQVSPNFKVGEATNQCRPASRVDQRRRPLGVAAFVDNVFDDRYVTGVNNLTANTFGTPFASISAPRTWGVDFKFGF